MGVALVALGIDKMKVEERIALVQDIWDSVALDTLLQQPNSFEKNELDCRLDEDDAMPSDTVPWETIKAQAQARWRR